MAMEILNGDHAEFEREHAATPPKERPDWPLPSFDARDWAEAFVQKNPDCGVDVDTMIGWFANALMRGHDERRKRIATELGHAATAAVHEIRSLRQRCEVLQAKADVVEIFGRVMEGHRNRGGMTMGEDPAWRLERVARAFQGEPKSADGGPADPQAVPA